MRQSRTLLTGLAIATTFLLVQAQPRQLNFDKFNDANGLPFNQVIFTIQDHEGIIWSAGADGLIRYDGYNVAVFKHRLADITSLSASNLVSVFEDSRKRLWVGTLGRGLNLSDPQKRNFQVIVPENDTGDVFSATVRHIVEDRDGRIWLGGNNGLHILEERNDRFYLVEHSICDTVSRATALHRDNADRIWIGTTQGLSMYDPGMRRSYCPGDFGDVPQRTVTDIQQDRHGTLWVTCHNQGPRLYYCTNDPVEFAAFEGVPVTSVSTGIQMAFDHDNRLWLTAFGERTYAYDFRDSALIFGSDAGSPLFDEQFIRAPFVDHTGNVWLHGEGFLIFRYPTGFQNYLHPFAFPQSVSCIYTDGDQLWTGYRQNGIVMYNGHTSATHLFSSEQKGNRFIPVNLTADMKRVSSGNLVLVGFDTISVLRPDGSLLNHFRLGGTNRAVFEDSQKRIWIGSIQGLFLFSETEGFLKRYSMPPLHGDGRNFIQGIAEDYEGNLWMATAIMGVAMLDSQGDTLRRFLPVPGDPNSLPSATIIDLTFDQSRKILWLATDVALVRFDVTTHAVRSYTTDDGLQNNSVVALTFDQDGMLWLSTQSGISRFDPQTEQFVNYSSGHGLINQSYYARAVHLSESGMLYFGGSRGLDYFDPSQLRANPFPPRMHLAKFVIGNTCSLSGSEIASAGGVSLAYHDKFFEIEFAGLHYTAPEKIRYQYRIEKLHDEWIDLGNQRQVLVSSLKAGKYVFRARAQTIDGLWSDSELSIPITVAAPFWATWWFRFVLAACIGLGIYVYIRMRETALRKKQTEEALIQRKISELEKRALQAQMNPHFIYNSMNSIQQFMIVRDFEGAMRYLTRFSRLLRTVLNMSAQNRIALSDEIKLIEDYIELENMRFPDKFAYDISVSPDLNIHAVEIPPFFIQPQVENAIRHGLLKKNTTGHLQIVIDSVDEHLRVVVEDDGIGREASRAAKLREGVVRESKGLSIMEERLSHLHDNGIHPLKIEDLYDAQQRPAGTRVEILLPLE